MSGLCDLHEMSNCATCSGADAKFQRSLNDPVIGAWEGDGLPFINGGVTIRSRHAGSCVSCGRRWDVGAAIFRAHGQNDVGWVCVENCV